MRARLSRRRALAAGLTLALTACTRSPAPTQPAPAAPTAPSAVTVVLWHSWANTERQILGALVDRFNRANPLGRVVLQMVPVAAMVEQLRGEARTGSAPQLALVKSHWLELLGRDSVVRPLDDLVTPADMAPLLEAALRAGRGRDAEGQVRLFGLPVRFDTLGLYYNGANILRTPRTTAEMLEIARGLTDTNPPPIYGMALSLAVDTMIGYLHSFGGQIFDERTGALVLGGSGRPGAERWLAWIDALDRDPRLLASANSLEIDRKLRGGQALMTIDWSYQQGVYRALWGPQLQVAPLPALSETGRLPVPWLQAEVLAITTRLSTPEELAAMQFLRYLTGPEAQAALLEAGHQPARSELDLAGDAPLRSAARAFRTQAEQSLPVPGGSLGRVVREAFDQMLASVRLGTATVPDAVTEADRRIRAALDAGES